MLTDIFIPELVGSFLLLLLGGGVVANVILKDTKGNGGGTLMINFGWGIAVFIGVYAAAKSGGHLNPAVTLGVWVNDPEVYGVAEIFTRFGAQLIGAFLGAVGVWLAYKEHFDDEPDPATKLGVFATGPAKRNYLWNTITEAIATFVLVFWVISANIPENANGLGALAVAFVIVGIGASLGGPTGYAINPTRDLGPRLAHAVLPIKGKGSSDWAYAWVPIVGPFIGATVAGLLAGPLLPALGA